MMNFAQWGNALYSGKRSYQIIKHSRTFLIAGIVLMLASVALLVGRGLNPSIEFSGGSQFIVTDSSVPAEQTAYDVLAKSDIKENIRVSIVAGSSVRIQTQTLDTGVANDIRAGLATAYDVPVESVQSSSVGATWGQDVTKQALRSIVIFVLVVTVLMTVYFRSWAMSAAALIALAHDLMITVGFFALTQVEVSPATVIGFLTILGYSLYDTVVVFDKVREISKGTLDQETYTFGELVNLGLNQTLVRTINTSVVALLPVGAILFIGSLLLGAGTLTDISLALFVGMFVGAWSSLFIAAPSLAMMEGARKKMKTHDLAVIAKRIAESGTDDTGAAIVAPVRVAPKTPGYHLGSQAQPRRKNRTKK